MKLYRFAPVLSLIVSLAAFGAAPVLSFDGADAVVTLPAGHRVVWIHGGFPKQSGLVPDSNADGQVRFTPPSTGSLAVVDVETGEWAVSPSVHAGVLGPGSIWGIDSDTTGTFSIYETGKGTPDHGMIWLRPGVGAWTPPAQFDEPLAVGRDFMLVDISTFQPVGASPATPSGVVAGDSFMDLEIQSFLTGLVDSAINAPYAGRLYFEDWSSSHVEDQTITVDVIRRLGTTGTITTSCQPSFTANEAPPGDKAQAGIDYVAFGVQPLTFGPGEIVKQCTFTLLDDGAYTDLPRDFFVELTPATGGALVDYYGGHHTVLIEDDDPAPVLSFGNAPASVVEGDAPWNLDVPWSLTGNFRGNIKIDFDLPYPSPDTHHVLTPSQASPTSLVPIAADNNPNPPKTLEMKLVPSGKTTRIQTVSRYLTITDDDTAPLPTVTLTTPAIAEPPGIDAKAKIRVQLASASTATVQLVLSPAGGTANQTQDYVTFQIPVTFQPGETIKDVEITIRGDAAVEDDETLVIVATDTSGNVVATTTLTILDNDSESMVTIADIAIVEKTGTSVSAIFEVRITPPPQAGASIGYQTVDGTAKAGSDFAASSGTLSFGGGQSTQQISVEVFGDSTTEQDEEFSIQLSKINGEGVSLGRDRADATIYDDDSVARPSVSIADIAVTEADAATNATFTLNLSASSTETVRVSYATADGTATAPADYEHRTGVVTFTPGETTRTIVIPITGDGVNEETETFSVSLSNGEGVVIPDVQATCTITDDDKPKRRSLRH